jgi:uncharacterized protein
MSANVQVWYRANSLDGFGAAWAAWRHFEESAAYHPVARGAPLPTVRGCDRLYLLGVSCVEETGRVRHGHVPHVTILTPQATTDGDSAGGGAPATRQHLQRRPPPRGIFVSGQEEEEESGATLAWRYFHGGRSVFADLLREAEWRDFQRRESRALRAALWSYPLSFETWECLARSADVRNTLLAEGGGIVRAEAQLVQAMCAHAAEITIGGYRVPCVNATVFGAAVGDALCQRFPHAPFVASYADRADGARTWELRARGGFDCRRIAKQYGGDGQADAAGFVTKRPPRLQTEEDACVPEK